MTPATGTRKQQRQILRPAFAQFVPVAIHAGAHGVRAVTKINPVPSLRNGPASAHLRESCQQSRRGHPPPHRLPGEPGCTVRSRPPLLNWDRAPLPADTAPPVPRRSPASRPAPQKVTTICSGEYDSKSARSFFASQGPRQRPRQMHSVRIGEQQPLSARLSRSGDHGVVLPRPSLRQRPGEITRTPGKALRDLAVRSVERVIHHDDLKPSRPSAPPAMPDSLPGLPLHSAQGRIDRFTSGRRGWKLNDSSRFPLL